jgi:hypothetical protein
LVPPLPAVELVPPLPALVPPLPAELVPPLPAVDVPPLPAVPVSAGVESSLLHASSAAGRSKVIHRVLIVIESYLRDG